ncbi:hypothetical protein [Accumulibacter sp.]|uniref:hypothetical protein n=1 Tax=Accumulibacter sp. TaxID=2053492 RepID=UPI0025D956E9|nr:hypothetical protein [Accumulibacter sp.]MCM8613958.1 hypothetical protein [Accumulibacter sp.]MCM8637779.1 hypothetical protein [Accumulibacter sp.]MCM8638810.1 hypothetical protein [Accumulibacter sp.]
MNHSSALSAVLTFLWLIVAPVVQAGEIQTQAVHFAKGRSSATIEGRIKGGQTIDYTLRAKAGQTMSVTLKTGHGANYFNVLPPGSNDEAIFIGSTGGNEWTGNLPADGEYKVRVYLMRSAARRNETASYTLTVGITGAPKASELGKAPASDARVKGTPYHATGPLPCSLGKGRPMQCEFGVIRGKPGNAEVHVTPPGGLKRILTFMGDKVTTNPDDRIKAVKQGDDWSVEVNDYEHYTIPEAVISGG